MRTRSSGFTLIELMITVAVIAILAAIALPSFNEQVRKSRRSTALADVGALQLSLEKWRADHPTYAGSGTGYPTATDTSHYDYAIGSQSATAYTVTATAQNAQDGDRCGVLTANAGSKPQWAVASCN